MFNFWKHKVNGQVISNDCKIKLPATKQSYYEPTNSPATHIEESVERTKYSDDSDDGFVTSLIAASVIESVMDSDTSSDTSSNDDDSNDNSSDFGGFDGGSSGGGGADSDF